MNEAYSPIKFQSLILFFMIFVSVLTMPNQINAQVYSKSPVIHADRSVTFTYYAPHAKSVKLQGNVPKISGEMRIDKEGIWSITVGPLEANTYPYKFNVDGATVMDPVNRNTKAWLWMENQVEVPPKETSSKVPLHQVQNSALVAHGAVASHWYHSPRLEQTREVFVYTPPGYQTSKESYPVLYLLHGFGDDASAWSRVGKAQHIADNMLSAKRGVPAIIVMPFGHIELPKSPNYEEYPLMENLVAMEKELMEGVIPFVEANYRCKTTAVDRAIAGLSMGGGHALKFGVNHLDKFGWITGFSSAIEKQKVDEVFKAKTEQLQANKNWLWLGCGKDDFLFEETVDLDKWLTKNKIEHKVLLSEGAHNWRCWRGYLEHVLDVVFVK